MYVANCVGQQTADRKCGLVCLMAMWTESTEKVTVGPVGN
jgi:hypothetical protein